ncbi:MAG: hypothetical protein P8046_15025 [Anaerolineales bacterium]
MPRVTDTSPPIEQTATPSPTIEVVEQPGLVILLASAQADQARLGEILPTIQEAASRHGLTFEQRESLSLDAVPENLKLVISFSAIEGLQQLIDGLPQVQFVAVDAADDLNLQSNVSALPAGNASLNAAFLAGYIAAVQSDEYRVGIISTSSAQGQDYRAPGASLDQIQQAAYNLQTSQVQIVHLDPQLETEPVLQILAQNGFYIVGSSAPPTGLESSWIASVLPEGSLGLGDVLESALNGQALGWVSSRPVIAYTGVGEARIRYFNELIEMLETDEIDPLGLVN